MTVVTAAEAWARLLGIERLERLQVMVDPGSPMTRPGWIGILTIGDAVTVRVPRPDLVSVLRAALEGVSPLDAIDPEAVLPRLPAGLVVDTLGPAQLFSPPADGFEPPAVDADVGVVDPADLLAAAAAEDLEESGIAACDSPVFGSSTAGSAVVAACGYRVWPNGVAHLSVLTSVDHRNQGHARRAAAAAVRHALDAGLLPQWRARVPASQRVAIALGFEHVGGQLGLQPAG